MSALALSADLEEFDWMLPPLGAGSELDIAIRRQRDTRLAAMLFKRRWRLLIHWRGQAHSLRKAPIARPDMRPTDRGATDAINVTRLPDLLPPLREEIAIWRSFLAPDINAILFGTA